jgi:tetratricopeptide (TPR) repeat protein
MECCKESIIIDPYFTSGYYQMAQLYREFENTEIPMEYFKLVIEVSKFIPQIEVKNTLALAYKHLGEMHFVENKFGEGFKYYETAIIINPGTFNSIQKSTDNHGRIS